MSTDKIPSSLNEAQDMLIEARREYDRANGAAMKAFNERDKANRLHEIIYDLSFDFGVRWQSCDEAFTNELDLLLGGALGRRDMIYDWAKLFDEVWQQKAEAGDTYWEDIDSFFQASFGDLTTRVEESIALRTRVISVQVAPVIETWVAGRCIVEVQTMPDFATTSWAVYNRLGDGTVKHMCDCANKAAAMMMGSLLAQSHGVEIESEAQP